MSKKIYLVILADYDGSSVEYACSTKEIAQQQAQNVTPRYAESLAKMQGASA